MCYTYVMDNRERLVEVALPSGLWDRCVDSIASDARRVDVDLSRRKWVWRGRRAVASVPAFYAGAIASYLRGVASLGVLGTDTDARRDVTAKASAASKAADAIEAQLDA